MSGPVIRRLGPQDADAHREIRLFGLTEAPEAFSTTYEVEAAKTREQIVKRLDDTVVFGAFVDEVLVGVAGFAFAEDAREQHKGLLWGMYVRPEARRLKLGAALVQAVLDHAAQHVEQIRLIVIDNNAPAIALYERMGFVAYGVEPRALKGPSGYTDDRLMVKFLNADA